MQEILIETNFCYEFMKAKKTENVNDYTPVTSEQYMSEKQIRYFKENLEIWSLQTQHNLAETEKKLAELNANDEHDEMDRAFIETEVAITINKISALQNLLNEIDISLNDIKNGNYGYCRKTGEPIGIKRLLAKPTSRFAIKAQEDSEREEKIKQMRIEEEPEVYEEMDELGSLN